MIRRKWSVAWAALCVVAVTVSALGWAVGQAQEGEQADTSPLRQTVDTLPEPPVAVEFARMTLAPGTGRELVVPGPEFYAVESGTLGIRVDGPAFLTRAATDGEPTLPEEMEPGVDYVLQPGDQALVLIRVAHRLVNDGQEPVTVLNVVIYEQASALPSWLPDAELPPGVGITPLAADVITNGGVLPDGAAEVAVERVTVAAGDELPAELTSNFALILVEEGVLSVAVEAGATPSPAATPTTAATPTMLATPIPPSQVAGDYLAGEVVRMAPDTAVTARNDGDVPLVVTALLIQPAEAARRT